jgi:hypothetical protein
MITWHSETQLSIDGVNFTIDHRAGKDRAKSTDQSFTLVKTKRLINYYAQLARLKPVDILEIGMFQGGSIVLFEKLYKPRRLVGIELSKEPIPALDSLVRAGSAVRAYY